MESIGKIYPLCGWLGDHHLHAAKTLTSPGKREFIDSVS